LSVDPIAGYPTDDAFLVARVVDGDYVPLELDGTPAHLFVQQVVVVQNDRCRTESYVYRLQADATESSWRMRWEYFREPPVADYPYPLAHVHVNGTFPGGEPIAPDHIPAPRMPLELVIQYLISDRDVKPRSKDWEAILQESAADFDHPSH
jgi:hypothetical protein